jgi:hypothetical protein
MRRAGRISLTWIIISAVVIFILGLVIFTPQTPAFTAAQFMAALAKGDVDKLTEMSWMGDDPPADIKTKWQKTVEAGKYYRFVWELGDTFSTGDNSATVKMQVMRNAAQRGAYADQFELPMLKMKGKWVVDVRAINRTVYPDLPR